jgi:Nucleotidyltransferase of unknown function (DUF6036)
MREDLLSLLGDLEAWAQREGVEDLECYLLGGGAMQLAHLSPRRTRDLDVVAEPLGEHAGAIARALGMDSGRDPYVDIVTAGLPVLATGWQQRAIPLEGPWHRLVVRCLSPVDLIISKLRSYRPHDRRDIQLVCDLHPELRDPLAEFGDTDFWTARDVWEDRIEPHRDLVLEYFDGIRGEL